MTWMCVCSVISGHTYCVNSSLAYSQTKEGRDLMVILLMPPCAMQHPLMFLNNSGTYRVWVNSLSLHICSTLLALLRFCLVQGNLRRKNLLKAKAESGLKSSARPQISSTKQQSSCNFTTRNSLLSALSFPRHNIQQTIPFAKLSPTWLSTPAGLQPWMG